MNNWFGLFLSPTGCIGRRSFWHGWLVLTAANVALFCLGNRLTQPEGIKAAAFPLITLYPTICLYAKRLHGLGKSGWLQAPPRLVWALCLATPLLPKLPQHIEVAVVLLFVLCALVTIWDAVLLWWSATGLDAAAGNAPATVFA